MRVLCVASVLLQSFLWERAEGHGSMIMPPSRNSVDADLPAWSHGKFPETGTIEPYARPRSAAAPDPSLQSPGTRARWLGQVHVPLQQRDGRVLCRPVVLLVLACVCPARSLSLSLCLSASALSRSLPRSRDGVRRGVHDRLQGLRRERHPHPEHRPLP